MKWLLIAVITAVVAVTSALVTVILISRRKRPKKTLFKKTYATGTNKEIISETKPPLSGTEPSPTDIQPVQPADDIIQTEVKSTPLQTKPPEADSRLRSPVAETLQALSNPATAMARPEGPEINSFKPAPAVAQTTAEAAENEAETIQAASPVTEPEPKSDPEETTASQAKQSPHFITEIESEPTSHETGPIHVDMVKKADKKTKEIPATTSKVNLSKKKSKSQKTEVPPAKTKSVKAESLKEETDTAKDDHDIEELKSDTVKTALKENETPDGADQPNLADKVSEALSSGKLNDWIALADAPLTPENFQAVIHKIVKTIYPKRKDKKMRATFRIQARRYIEEFKITPPADAISEYIYKSMAIVLQEDQKFEEAIALCRKAIELGMDDGTKTGYSGRIDRLKKAQSTKK